MIILLENATEKIHSDFIKEIELMKRAGDKYNSHVVSMICCTMNQEPKALVLEYIEHGDLLQYLQKNKVFVSVKALACIYISIYSICVLSSKTD